MKTIFSIWMQPIYARLNMGDHKVWLMVLATFPLLTMGIAAFGFHMANNPLNLHVLSIAALLGIAFVVILLIAVWFCMLVPSVALQYSPANARLVPHLKSYSQWALALPVLLLPGLIILGLMFKSTDVSPSLAWLGGVFVLLMGITIIRSKWMILVLVAMTQLPILLSKREFSIDSLRIFDHPVLSIALGLLMTAGVLHWVFALDADNHFQQRKKFSAMQMAMDGNLQALYRDKSLFAPSYMLLFSRLLQRHLKSTASGKRLLPFSLGPHAHWSVSLLQMLIISIGISAYLFIINRYTNSSIKEEGDFYLWALFFVCALTLPLYIFATMNAIYQTRIEQGVVSLAPGIPSYALQTRTMLAYLLRQFFLLWCITLLVGILSSSLLASNPTVHDSIYLACFSLLPLSACIFKNHAKTKGQQDSMAIHILMLCTAIFAVSLISIIYLAVVSVWMLCVTIALMTIFTLVWRWNKLLAMAAVFPPGRGV